MYTKCRLCEGSGTIPAIRGFDGKVIPEMKCYRCKDGIVQPDIQYVSDPADWTKQDKIDRRFKI